MNAQRRKDIAALVARIHEAHNLLDELAGEAHEIMDQEQEYRDGMPEAIGAGAKGDETDARIEALQSAADELEIAASSMDDVVTSLDEAAQ